MFAGRTREISLLRGAMAAIRANRNRGSVFLVSGEAGIGKTRLIEEAIDDSPVVWGAAWDGGGAPAYWPWTQVLRGLATIRPEVGQRSDLPSFEDALASKSSSDALQFRLFDALRSVLERSAPLIVVLDDLHAADIASLQALRFIAQTIKNAPIPIALIATFRDTEPDLKPEIAAILAQVARSATTTVRLGPLGRDDIARMILTDDNTSDTSAADAIHDATAGNPLFVNEVLLRMQAGVRSSPDAGLRAVIHDRLMTLPTEIRAILDMAAVLGRESPKALLAEACGCGLSTIDAALRGALAFVSTTDPVRFTHPLFRECTYEAIRDRGTLHVRAAQILRRTGGSAESIAGHLLSALPEGDPLEAADYADHGAEEACRTFAFDRAVVLWEGALGALRRVDADVVDVDVDTMAIKRRRRVDIELRLATALTRIGAGDRARKLCADAAIRVREMGDAERLAHVALAYGSEMRIAVVDPLLVELLEEVLASPLIDIDRGLRAHVMARLAAANQPAIDARLPIEQARKAVVLARETGDRAVLIEVLHWAAAAFASYAHPIDRLAVARELASLALQRGDLARAQEAYMRIALAAAEQCAFEELDDAIRSAEQLGVALGHPRWKWSPALFRAMRASIDGRWSEVDALHDAIARIIEEVDDPMAQFALVTHRLGTLRSRGGSVAEVQAVMNMLRPEVWARHGDRVTLWRAATLVRLGHLDAARQTLVGISLPPSRWQPSPQVLVGCAEIAVGLEDRDLAERVLPKLQEVEWPALAFQMGAWEGPISWWVGGLLKLVGRTEEAGVALEEALRLSESIGAKVVAEAIRKDLAQLAAPSPSSSPSSKTRPSTATTLSFTMEREGEVWKIECGEKNARLKHSRGLSLLHELVMAPGKEFHVFDLASGAAGMGGGEVIDLGDAGEVLDAKAKAAYRDRLRALDDELREAEAWSDEGRRERLAAERDFLVAEIARGVGLGDRTRRSGGASERARINVQKRLREVIRRIVEVLPSVGEHLENYVKTGTYVSYRPPSRP